MRGKNISFAQVLKNKTKRSQTPLIKSQCKLADMLVQWRLNPSQIFTLNYGSNFIDRSSQYMTVSSKQQKGAEFDTFIERQTLEQINSSNWKNNHNKNVYLRQRDQNRNSQFCDPSTKNRQKLVLPPPQVEMIHSKNYGDESVGQSYSKRYQEEEYESENNQYAANKPTSDRLNSTKKEQTFKEIKKIQNTPTVKKKELQKIIDSTDHIHEDIADLAHKYVLEKKKQSQKQDQLLLSLQDQEKLLVEKKKSSQRKKYDQNNQQKLRQQAKQQINIFLKRNQIESFVPTFGPAKSSIKEDKGLKQSRQCRQDSLKLEIKQVTKNEVGYSFATCMLSQPEPRVNFPEAIPMLELNERAPTIPLIQEIASERQYSEGNEQIDNMYSKWHKQELINISHENIQNIESMCYLEPKEQKLPGCHSGGKKQSIKEDKPTITFYKEEVNPSIFTNKDREVDIEEPDPQGHSYADALCFSKTEKKEESPRNSSSQVCKLSSPSSGSLCPQRDIYLSNEHPEYPEETEEQNKIQTKEFDVPKDESAHKEVEPVESLKKEAIEQKVEIKQKQSPRQYFHGYGLNKVYSNGKTVQNNKETQQVQTSDFNAPKEIKQSGGKISIIGGSNKSKEKGGFKIESYANTSMFSICQKPEPKKEQDQQQFTFDL